VPERLFESYKGVRCDPANRSPPDYEFLVLKLTSNGKKLVHVTKDGLSYCERKYIGDAAEYKKMTGLREPYVAPKEQMVQQTNGTFLTVPLEVSSGEAEFAEIDAAMEELTNSNQKGAVGAICGGITRVVDARRSGKLEYLQSGESSATPAEGHSGYSFLASNSDARGIGIYYRSGKMGFVFRVGDSEPCRKERAETVMDFIKITKEKYGMDLEGVTFD
jgi:hypothetical protein